MAELALLALAHQDPSIRALARAHLELLQDFEREHATKRRFALLLLERACELETLYEGPEDVLTDLLLERLRRRETYYR